MRSGANYKSSLPFILFLLFFFLGPWRKGAQANGSMGEINWVFFCLYVGDPRD